MRERTVKIGGVRATARRRGPFWGRGGTLLFYSPPRGASWAGCFGVQFDLEQPLLGLLVSAREARQLAAELIRRAEDVEARGKP